MENKTESVKQEKNSAVPTGKVSKDNTLKTAQSFTPEARRWMARTVEMYDDLCNGFGATSEVYKEVRGRGWYKTINGWLSLTEKGRAEIPAMIAN